MAKKKHHRMGRDEEEISFWDWLRLRPPAERPRPELPPPPPRPGEPEAFWMTFFGRPRPLEEAVPAAPAPRPAAPPPRQAGQPAWVKPSVDPGQYFDLKGLFDYVRSSRQAPGWRPPASLPLLQVISRTPDPVRAASLAARFFRIPESEVSRYREDAWEFVIEPFVRELERALNVTKPAEIPGAFRFEFAADGSYGLAYYE